LGDSKFTNATPYHVPQPVKFWSKSGNKEGHFSLDAETVFRLYLGSHWSWVTQTSRVVLPPYPQQTAQVWSKLGGKEGHFTVEAGTVLHSYLASHCSCMTQT
jgi:hypothetical protein